MNRISVRLLLILTVLALLGEGQVRADMMTPENVQFSYHWDILPQQVIAGTGANNTASVQFNPVADGTGTYTIAPANQTPTQASLIPGATLTTLSSATNPPDTFSTPYAMKLTLTDPSSTTPGTLTFSGTLSGSLTKTTAQLTGTFDPGTVTQTTTVGGHTYTVTIDPALVNLPAPANTTAGNQDANTAPVLIDAFISAVDAASGTPGPTTPEPSSLVLAATAVLGVAARRWSRSRGRRVEA